VASFVRVTSYFRLHPADEDPQELLEPENQVSRPWGSADEGPCDKCGGAGRVTFQCASCMKHADPRCESCHGEVEFEGECPTCKGTGEVSDTERRGVSVFPDADGLYRYMLRRDSAMEDSILVELEGEESDDVDFDADEGALLVVPTRIVQTCDVDREQIERVAGKLEAGG
jgi:hypothetical protein